MLVATRPQQSEGAKLRLLAKHRPGRLLKAQGEHPWEAQSEILSALYAERELYVPSCHASGKTFIGARAAGAWVMAHWPKVLVVILSPTDDQLIAGLMKELSDVKRRWRGLPGRLGIKTWTEQEHGIIAIGRSPRPERPGTLQGMHSPNLLLVIEEASEVDDRLWEAADSLLTGSNTRLLAIGNPTNPTGEFHKRATGRALPGVKTITIDAFSTPNLEGIEPVDDLSDVVQVERLREQLLERMTRPAVHEGLVDARYVLKKLDDGMQREWDARVRAKWPEGGDDVVIPRSWVDAARREDPDRRRRIEGPLKVGVDIARMGSDRSVLMPRLGGVVMEPVVWGHYNLMQSAGKIKAWAHDHDPVEVNIDEGLGIGIVDRLQEQDVAGVREFKHNEAPRDPDKFADRRTEYWWTLRDIFEAGGVDLSQLSEETFRTLAEELAAPRYSYTSSGKRVIEQKKETKKRLGRSPDLADALVYAGWMPAIEWTTSVV